ncbi:MAG: xanthine dehydrogenase family protein molybdopterin-binding subunit, partial [Gammaproteobacteria bacterium]
MKLTRRKFLIGTGVAGSALVLGFALREPDPIPHTRAGSFQPNAWLQITEDGRFIFQLDKTEMGQGVINSMPTVLAEELDIDPARLEVEMAGVHRAFGNRVMGVQITGGSTSTLSTWMPLREAGATARALLVAAAAQQWRITSAQCQTDDGEVINGVTGERASYASLAMIAKALPAPESVVLKQPQQFRWIGRSLPRRDAVAKSTGQATFGVDIQLPDMKVAVVVRCPHFGGKAHSWIAESVTAKPGVVAAFEIHAGIAIVADTYWQARKAADGLQVTWDKGPLAGLDSSAIRQQQEQA